jgi:hypothetical protein
MRMATSSSSASSTELSTSSATSEPRPWGTPPAHPGRIPSKARRAETAAREEPAGW